MSIHFKDKSNEQVGTALLLYVEIFLNQQVRQQAE
jgi:hypothetical protein